MTTAAAAGIAILGRGTPALVAALLLAAIAASCAVDGVRRHRRLRRDLAEVRELGRAMQLHNLSSPALRRRHHDSAVGGGCDAPPDTGCRTSAAGASDAPAAGGHSLSEALAWRCEAHPGVWPSVYQSRDRVMLTCRVCARSCVHMRLPSSPPPPYPPAANLPERSAVVDGYGGGR